MLKFELLKEDDVVGDNCLSIFKKISPCAMATDVALYTMKSSTSNNCPYWLNSYHHYFTEPSSWQIGLIPNVYAKYMSENIVNNTELNDRNLGIRLKIAYDDIKDEIVKDEDGKIYEQLEDGIKVVFALEFPQTILSEEDPDKKNLDLLYSHRKLKYDDNKSYTILDGVTNDVTAYGKYYYKQKTYTRIEDKWAIIEPIEWYYDEEEQVLVNKKIILGGIPLSRSNGHYIENFNYKESVIAHIINTYFSKQALMDPCDKRLNCLPLTISYEYKEELEKIKYWEEYRKKREERRKKLLNLKQLIQNAKDISEFEDLVDQINFIDEILELNEEDEKLVKAKYPV